jgi:phenylpyruvate tautomerase PptA (4-oxalocrotonate tautomerase family)
MPGTNVTIVKIFPPKKKEFLKQLTSRLCKKIHWGSIKTDVVVEDPVG